MSCQGRGSDGDRIYEVRITRALFLAGVTPLPLSQGGPVEEVKHKHRLTAYYSTLNRRKGQFSSNRKETALEVLMFSP